MYKKQFINHHFKMNALEQKILELLPLLSEDAKFKARLILGENPTKRKENEIIRKLKRTATYTHWRLFHYPCTLQTSGVK